MIFRTMLLASLWRPALGGGGALSLAATLAAGEADALAFSGIDMSAYVMDTGTPANNFDGDANDLFTYTAPSGKWIRLASGLWAKDTTMRTEYGEAGDPLGLRVEEARTALAIRPRELGNATYWQASNITTSPVQGVDGVLAAATRITATAGNGTVRGYSNLSASAACRLAPFVRRVTGTGNLEWTLDGGSTWTAYSGITSSWQRLTGGQTVANPRVGFRIVDSGDEFDIDFANGEFGTFDTSPLHVDGATGVVTRAEDRISLATSAFPFSATTGTLSITTTVRGYATSNSYINLMQLSDGTTANRHDVYVTLTPSLRYYAANSSTLVADISTLSIPTVGVDLKTAIAYAVNDATFVANGAIIGTDVSGTPSTSLPTLYIGNIGHLPTAGVQHVKQIMYRPRRVTNAALQTETAA